MVGAGLVQRYSFGQWFNYSRIDLPTIPDPQDPENSIDSSITQLFDYSSLILIPSLNYSITTCWNEPSQNKNWSTDTSMLLAHGSWGGHGSWLMPDHGTWFMAHGLSCRRLVCLPCRRVAWLVRIFVPDYLNMYGQKIWSFITVDFHGGGSVKSFFNCCWGHSTFRCHIL